ncbi:uncharacterized protein LOC116917317 [Daphnia magna]|nr:uncharacterized protein LOC116917317 [Daphnia magna]KZS17770.1 Uncharacterized protein APZ42_016185 [Daphnia magna]
MYKNKKICLALAVCFILVLTMQNCNAKRETLKKLFGFLDFDARDVKSPAAVAPRAPVVYIPQYRSADPIYLQPLTKPVPEVMLGGVSPYSNLDANGRNNPALWQYSHFYPEHQ